MRKRVCLPDGCMVFADEVKEVEINVEAGTVTVRMQDGIGHTFAPDPAGDVFKLRNYLFWLTKA